MATRFVNIDRQPRMLLPPDLREWVPANHVVHFILEAVEQLPTHQFLVNRRGTGSAQFPPKHAPGPAHLPLRHRAEQLPPVGGRHPQRRGRALPHRQHPSGPRHDLRLPAGEPGIALYKLRKQTVEPVFGIIKEAMGFRRFRLRGREGVELEWVLVCVSYNLKRLFTLKNQAVTR